MIFDSVTFDRQRIAMWHHQLLDRSEPFTALTAAVTLANANHVTGRRVAGGVLAVLQAQPDYSRTGDPAAICIACSAKIIFALTVTVSRLVPFSLLRNR
jgi:hypothetical protein